MARSNKNIGRGSVAKTSRRTGKGTYKPSTAKQMNDTHNRLFGSKRK